MATNYLTRGRRALVDALQADARMAGMVRTWHTMEAGLLQRMLLDPAWCPLCAVAPYEAGFEVLNNWAGDLPQVLLLTLGARGPEAEVIEAMVTAAQDVVWTAMETGMGLGDAGLARVDHSPARITAEPDEQGVPQVWRATMQVRLLWKRTRPLWTD